jgi:hypothetical protein
MGCKRYQKWIHLHRSGELSVRRMQKVNRHLEQCRTCTEVRDRIVRTDLLLARMRQSNPRLVDPGRTTSAIMDSIGCTGNSLPRDTNINHRYLGPITTSIFRSIKERLSNDHKMSFGLAAVAVLIVGVFFIQESLILSHVSRLEERMVVISKNTNGFASSIRFDIPFTIDCINAVKQAGLLELALPEEWVTVKKTELEALIQSYRDFRLFNAVLLKIIQKNHPEVRTLDDAMSSDSEKAIRILIKNPNMIKWFYKLSKSGGQT